MSTPEPIETSTPLPSGVVTDRPAGFVARHPTLVYSALRIGLLVVTLGVVWLLGARGLLWLLLGFLISGLLSLVLLSRQRDAMSRGVSGFFGRINDRIESSRRAEDDDEPVDVVPEVEAGAERDAR